MNVATILDMAAGAVGDRVAVGNRGDGLTVTAVRDRAQALAAGLPRDIRALATLAPTSEMTPVVLFGAAWAGVSYAPLNFRLPGAVRARQLARLEPAVLFDPRETQTAPGEMSSYPENPEHPAVLLLTSGTSAAPKAAVLEHEHLLAYVLNTLEFASASDDEAVLVAVPPFHIAGVAAVLSATYAGRRIVPMAQFDTKSWLATVDREQITHAFVVPTMLSRIVEVLERDPHACPSALRHLAYGGARMPVPVIERALRLMPDVGFVNAYGLTETSSTVCVLGPEDHRGAVASDDPRLRARLSAAGRPVPGIEIRIVDDTGQPEGPDVVGEIHLRGDQVGGGYLDADARRTEDGWLCTGDVGWLDGEGYLFVQGRGDGTIIRGGENLAAAEIEDTLLAHGSVRAAAVVGLPDVEWGERVAAVVVPRQGASIDTAELRAFAHERLGGLKTPSVLAVRSDLPETATGKVLFRLVREDLLEHEAATET